MRGTGWHRAAILVSLLSALLLAGCGSQQLPSLDSGKLSPTPNIFDQLLASSGKSAGSGAARAARSGTADEPQQEIYLSNSGLDSADSTGSLGDYRPASFEPGNDGRDTRGQRLAQLGATQTSGAGVNLNFEDADVDAVAKAVLGDILGLNYAVSPDIVGTVSLSSQRPIDRGQLLVVLEDALRAQGVVLVEQEGVYRLLPSEQAQGLGGAPARAGIGVTAIPLRHISAENAQRVLDGFGAPEGSVRILPEQNVLLARGTYSERKHIVETVLAFDMDWLRDQSVGIFPVRNASPQTVISELARITDSGAIQFQPIDRMNAILAVSKSQANIHKASTWISRLDRVNDAGARVRVYRLRNADSRRIVELLQQVFGAGGGGLSPAVNGDQIAPGAEQVAARANGGTFSDAGGGTPAPVPDIDARGGFGAGLDSVAGSAEGNIRFAADVTNNSVVVFSSQEDSILIERAIRDLDQPAVQVAIEATIAEITLNDSLDNGVQFFLTSKMLGGGNDNGSIAQLVNALPLERVVPGLNLLLGPEASPNLVIDALREVTDVKVLSSPSLVVVENQPAILQIGDQVPITTQTAQDVTNPTAPVVNSIEFRDTGVILSVTPRVNADSTVNIDVEQEISSVKETPTANTLTPTISQRKVKSMVSVGDGQTLLLAGMISEQRTKGKSGLPGVVDMPVIGNLLSQHTDGNTRTELIIFIKPQVVRNALDARHVAEDLRRRMKGFDRW